MTPTGTLIRDGLSLSVHDAGGPGLPVVFQHGLCGDAAQTAEAFPDDPRFRRITLECRGHGTSEIGADTGAAIATFAGDVAALIERLGGPVVVGGISMGAAIALRLAVVRPDLVSALVLVRPAWLTDAAPENMHPNAEVGAFLARFPPAKARAAFARTPTAVRLAAMAPDNLASLMGFFNRVHPALTARLLTAISADGPGITMADLGRLSLPVLVCATKADVVHPVGLAKDLAAAIPGATLRVLPPKGRDMPAHLAALHQAITDFLKDL